MNIILKNSNGLYLTVGSGSDAACLVDAPDFGEIGVDFKTFTLPGALGTGLLSKTFSPRDITIKFEARRISEGLINRTLSPLSGLKIIFDGRFYCDGFVKATAKREQKYEIMPPVYTVQIRLFDPCFYKLNNNRTVPFLNHAINLYENGTYKYQKLSLYNDGDLPCPVKVKMKALERTACSGLFTAADWNDGAPKYTGYRFVSPITVGTEYCVSSDIWDVNGLESYEYFMKFDPVILLPGQNTLYALNAEGVIEYNPKFLSIGGEA